MIYLLTAIGLSPGGSTHLHTNNTQNNTSNNHKTINFSPTTNTQIPQNPFKKGGFSEVRFMLPLLLTIKKWKSSSSLETTECCMNNKVAWGIYKFDDEHQMQWQENKQLRGKCTVHAASRTRETLIGGKFYCRPLFVQPSTMTYFSWQTRTRGSENKAVLVLCDSEQLLELTKEYSVLSRCKLTL